VNFSTKVQRIFDSFMFKYIFSKKFAVQFILALALVTAAIAGGYIYLVSYTEQDEVVEVPELSGYDVFEADAILNEAHLSSDIVDSLYLPEKKGGEIVDQEPIGGSFVKTGRKIYLTISRYGAPMVKLPNIIDQTLPLAMAKLKSYDINVDQIINKPSDCTDCVIGVEMNGKKLVAGSKLSKGSKINLIVGEGATGEKISIPMLYGLSLDEAQKLLNLDGLNIGATPYIDCENSEDSLNAKVFRQNPAPSENTMTTRGSSIDLYLTSDYSQIPEVNLDSIKSLLK
jgi:eukaryotic-like serine/threonine-protein kinase